MKTNFKTLTAKTEMVIFNNASYFDLELEAWSDYNNETDEVIDVFQYFVINENDWKRLAEITNLPLYYSEELDLHILGITFYWTPWESVEFNK